jgi:glycosyltransferase involved in cell wall biosynthesis
MYYSYFDSYPTVILEAQLAGLPVVSNPAFGITEQIEHNENGWLVDPKSYSENKRLVNNLFQNYEETSKVGLNAKKRVEDHNNKRKIGSILEEFILGF